MKPSGPRIIETDTFTSSQGYERVTVLAFENMSRWRTRLRRDHYSHQCRAVIERWDGQAWHEAHHLGGHVWDGAPSRLDLDRAACDRVCDEIEERLIETARKIEGLA